MTGAINFRKTAHDQTGRHIGHIGAVATVGCLGFWAKPKLQHETLRNIIEDPTERKIVAYAATVIGGAAIGAAAKGARTGTYDGMMVGLVVGAMVSFVGALLSEFRNPPDDPASNPSITVRVT